MNMKILFHYIGVMFFNIEKFESYNKNLFIFVINILNFSNMLN